MCIFIVRLLSERTALADIDAMVAAAMVGNPEFDATPSATLSAAIKNQATVLCYVTSLAWAEHEEAVNELENALL